MYSQMDSSKTNTIKAQNCMWCEKIANKKVKLVSIDIAGEIINICPVCQNELNN
jgi:hypothetical protein